MRRYRVESGSLRVWHVSEFSRTEIPEASHGQFHQGDTYVIRWPFKVLHVGLRDVPTRNAELLQEQCAYFFWQGSQSKVTEQGAAALMTIELDEERGPQLRVTEGKEPPAFCRLFNGRMVIYSGRRNPGTSTDGTSDTPLKVKLFLVCGEVPTEGFLIEVPPRLSSLRPQGVFLAVQYDTNNSDAFTRPIQKAWLWIGHCVPETNLLTARHVIETLKQSCPSELAADLRSVFEVQQTTDKSVPGDLVSLLNAEGKFSAPLCLDVQPARGPFVIWQLTSSVEQRMAVRRLEYTLQPDSSLMSNSATRLQAFKHQSSSPAGANPFEMAKAVAERLRTSNDACNVPQRNADVYLTFPFLLRELYAVCQPALFLILAGTEAVYLWQGWWPSSVHLKRQQLSSSLRHRSSIGSATSQTSLCEAPSRLMDQPEGDDVAIEPCITGSARSRFYTLRRAALQTAVSLAAKVGSKAWVVYAGLEPPEFLSLFPPFIRTTEASTYFQREEGKVDGQQDFAESLLSSLKAPSYTLVELQQRPLPSDLDATCLEIYLSPEEFQAAFEMPRDQFDQLPGWKKGQLRKQLGLF
ncbi:supervillin [Paragonimus westermani]|uniref:Supervillin n=1 Tax=Paragonimus westermani TaxID=34504 RepID=A0A5J4NGD7_9TREM|nr:supervillin [Paragonimus westermani]